MFVESLLYTFTKYVPGASAEPSVREISPLNSESSTETALSRLLDESGPRSRTSNSSARLPVTLMTTLLLSPRVNLCQSESLPVRL